ncbi:hypothetical protein quinque_015310 [Culex quinquefasciatus]
MSNLPDDNISAELPTILDLPTEILEIIFSHLQFKDRMSASLVCRRWSGTAIPLRKVLLKIAGCWDRSVYGTFLATDRPYRHLEVHNIVIDWSHDNLDFIRPIWQHRFPLLTRFKCDVLRSSAGGYANSYELEHFLKSCTSLRAISLDGLTQEARFFRNLGLACVNLRELSFRAAILGQEHFLHLCQMPQLRRLYVCQAKLTFRTANFQYPASGVRDLVLERADIWNVERFNRFIAMAFPALVSLRMNYFKSSAAGSLRLEELHLEEHGGLDLHLLEDFATLPKLRSVKLGSPQFDVLSFQPRPRLDHIRALGLRTQFNDEYLLRLAELFPRLASLQLCGRPLHTEGGREAVRKLLPGCDLRLPVEGEIVPLRYFTPFSMMVERRCCDDD